MKYTYVGVTLVRDDGAVLVQHRDDNPEIPEPNKWGMCGGRREITDVSNAYAGARELFEETGYVVNPDELILIAEDEFDVGNTHISRKFYVGVYDGQQQINCLEGQEITFIPVEGLSRLDFCESYHERYLMEAGRHLERA
jgi:8-oxo-dGTP pyrophosphatase MutT (NUDIX family)